MRRLREIELRTPLGEGPGGARLCDQPGCTEEGLYRAPKSRDRLTDYYVFCLDHVRDYNSTWDYYRGMSQDQIEAHIRYDTVWQRPTWPLGSFGSSRSRDPLEAIRDGFGFFAEHNEERKTAEERLRPANAEEKALSVLGLKPPTVFAEIKRRYKELVKRLHPDANGGDKGAEEQLKVINQAYSTLKQAAQGSGR
jgi:DnaJ-like protein